MEREKGNPVQNYVSNYVVFDLETTGTNINMDEIIEIGAIRVREGKVVAEYQTLVNPECKIPKEASAVNGITDDMVKDAPIFRDIADELWAFLGNDVLVGYNIAGFDLNMLYDRHLAYVGMPLQNDYIDLLYAARRSMTDLDNHRLTSVCGCFGIDTSKAHRALDDCYMTQQCYEKLHEQFGDSAFKGYTRSYSYQPRDYRDDVQGLQSIDQCAISSLRGKHFVLTGDFNYGSRDEVRTYIEGFGAVYDSGVRKSTNYLIIGAKGSQAWKTGTYGTKIKKAMDLKEQGQDIAIISEEDFFAEMENSAECQSTETKPWQDQIREMLTELIVEYELPEDSLYLSENPSPKDPNRIISYSICIFEPDYPRVPYTKRGVNKSVITLSPSTAKSRPDDLDFSVREVQAGDMEKYQPSDVVIMPQSKSDKELGMIRMRISKYSEGLVSYVRHSTEYCIKGYESKAARFGCCSQYVKCSDAKKCVHENKLYSKACLYRDNLDNGRIFYGKNRNVD